MEKGYVYKFIHFSNKMSLKQGDFIEIEFSGKIKNGGLFDSNIFEEVKKLNPKAKKETIKPLAICLGQSMFLKGIEEFLIGKDLGEYEIELSPEKAFGKRDSKLIQRIPIKIFYDQKINPVPGVTFNFDGKIGRVLASSGGRVLIDFNNPLSGKEVIYKLRVLKIVEDLNEKVKAVNDFLFRRDFEFIVQDKRLVLSINKGMKQFAELFKDKYKEMLGLELEVKEVEEKKEKPQENKEEQEKIV